jgi:sarcosine oxidase
MSGAPAPSIGTPARDPRYNEDNIPVWADRGEHFMYSIRKSRTRLQTRRRHPRPRVQPHLRPAPGQRRPSGRRTPLSVLSFPRHEGCPLAWSPRLQYEDSTDYNFIIDRHPANPNVWIVGGSGHGLKHGPALGEMVARLVLQDDPVDPLYRLARFQLPDK